MTDRTLPSTPAGRIGLLLANTDLSLADLRQALDLPDAVSMDQVMAEDYKLSPTDLVAVADLLDVPVGVLTGQIPMDRHLGVSLRLGTVEADVPVEALRQADGILRYRALLDSWLGPYRSPLANVDMSTDRFYKRAGQESARRVRDGLRLGEEPISDLVQLVEQLGYPVIFRPLPEGVCGLNVRDEREGIPTRVIIISTQDPWTRQRYTLAHELCHALYDDAGQVIVDLVEVPDKLPELRAECFARHLLLPVKGLARDVRDRRLQGTSWEDITAWLMVRWGASRVAVLRALENDKLANTVDLEGIKNRPIAQLMTHAHLTEEWNALSSNQDIPSGSPWLIGRALEAYSNGWVGVHVVANLLGQDVETTHQQLVAQGWVTA